MQPRPRIVRLLLLVAALLQTTAPGAAAVGDGWLRAGATSGVASAHVEATGGANCPAAHLDDCALCRALSIARAPERAPSLQPVRVAAAPQPVASRTATVAGGATRRPPPRAPPAAV